MTKYPNTRPTPACGHPSHGGELFTNKRRENNPLPGGVAAGRGGFSVLCFVIPSCLGASRFEIPVAFISPGGGELIMIMLVLILLFGAKDAPKVFRSIQSFLDKFQRSAAAFRYKMMYGDIHQNTTPEEPYDVEADYPHDGDEPDEENVEPNS